jgi:hypothetical protein
MSDRPMTPDGAPIRSKMEDEEFYQGLDVGIRFAVRVLHAAGIETGQSCQGGASHCYPEPTVEFRADADDARGFAALSALQTYGLKVSTVSLRWHIFNGLPYEKLWQITFVRTMEERADEEPGVVWGYQFQ